MLKSIENKRFNFQQSVNIIKLHPAYIKIFVLFSKKMDKMAGF